MSYNQEQVNKVMDLYGCQNLVVDREGRVYAQQPSGMHTLIPGFTFDTDTMDGTVTNSVIEKAMTTGVVDDPLKPMTGL